MHLQFQCKTNAKLCDIPDCPGGGTPDGPRGRHISTVSTAAFPPEQGSMATGLGGPFEEKSEEEISKLTNPKAGPN